MSLLCKITTAICDLLSKRYDGIWAPPHLFSGSSTVLVGAKWLGAVPAIVKPTKGLRISCNSNTGVTIVFNITKGAALTPVSIGNITWVYVPGQHSLAISAASIATGILSTGILAGERVNVSIISVSGSYGTIMQGLQLDFIGKVIIV